MNNARARGLTYGIAIGAGLMFLFDPRGGGARRAIVRQKGARAAHEVEAAVGIGARDLSHRAHGVAARVFGRRPTDVSPEKLVARVRTKLGRVTAHPHAIEVHPKGDGMIELKGPVLGEEHERIVSAIARVPGVREIDDDLVIHQQADIPSLQGGSVVRREPMLRMWTPATRFVLGTAAAGLSVISLLRGRPLGLVLGGTIALALARSIAHRGAPPRRALSRQRVQGLREAYPQSSEWAPSPSP